MTLQQAAKDIADAMTASDGKLWVRNKRTGQLLKGDVTPEQVWNFDSHGELSHIYDWHLTLFPERAHEWGTP